MWLSGGDSDCQGCGLGVEIVDVVVVRGCGQGVEIVGVMVARGCG